MSFASIQAVEWSDWVIRLPGGGDSTEGTFLLLLIGAAVLWALVKGLMAIADKIWPLLWSAVTLFAALLALVLIGRFVNSEEREPGRTITTEIRVDDCNDELLDRCPPLVVEPSE